MSKETKSDWVRIQKEGKCRNCGSAVPVGFRMYKAGRNLCCTRKCADTFVYQELARLERTLSYIVAETRESRARSIASIALTTNQEPSL